MAGNEFREWPEVHTPSSSHDANGPRTYEFSLTDKDKLAGEEVSRGLSVGSIDGSVVESEPHGFVYRHRRELIGIVALVAVAAAVTGVTLGLRQHVDSQEALSSCQQSVSIYQDSTQRLKKTIDDAANDLQIAEDQVQDPKTVTNLHAVVDKGNEKTHIAASCDASASVEDNQSADREITSSTRLLGNKIEDILNARIAVEDSKNARDVSVAKADLSNKVNEAQNVLGTVNSTDLNARQNLSAVLNESQQLATMSNSTDQNVYINQTSKLQDAINKFNATAVVR